VDRTHRIGQTKTVMVYRLVAKDTIEQKVMDLKARKKELFESVVGGEALAAAALTADEIRGLLGA
jgi:SNF2 family DNA or RNA helicase